MVRDIWRIYHRIGKRLAASGCLRYKWMVIGYVAKYKARLVSKAFNQKFGTDYEEVFAPEVRQVTFRGLLTAVQRGMLVEHGL